MVINAFFPGISSPEEIETEPDEFTEEESDEEESSEEDSFEEDFEEETEDTIEEKEFAEPGVLMDGAMIVLCIAALLAGLFGAGIVGGLVL